MGILRGLKGCSGPLVALAVLAVPSATASAQEVPQLRSGLLPAEVDPLTSPQSQTGDPFTNPQAQADVAGATQPPVDTAVDNGAVAPQRPPQSPSTTQTQTPVKPPPRRKVAVDRNAPLGVRAGAFYIYPAIGIGATYSDNVNQSNTAPENDIGLRVAPDLRIESDWVRHAYTFTSAGDFVFFDKHPEYNDINFDAAGDLRLDVRHDTTLDLRAGYNVDQTFGSSSEVPASASSQRLDQSVTTAAEFNRNLGRLTASLTGGADWYWYGNVKLQSGATESNKDRNYVQPIARLRFGYQTYPVLVPFVAAAYEPRVHELKYDRNGLQRDSQGGYLKAGFDVNASGVWSGEMALRYDFRKYADPSLGTATMLGLDGNIVWRPTRLTTVTFTATSGLNETSDANATAIRDWTGAINVAHQLRDDVVLTAGIAADYASYIGITLNELTLSANAAVRYILRRNVELEAGYTLTDYRSTSAGSDYVENRVSAGLRLRM